MSDSYETTSPNGSGLNSPQDAGKVDAAKQEAADLKDTATAQAKDVAGTAKDEAATVVGEVKYQAKDLFAQTRRELTDQANTQQQRIAGGLRSVSDELGAMASNSEGSGVTSDVVHQVAGRLSAASTWLGDRDPGSVLSEVKRFARRSPGTFILAAAVTGIVVGRLTRALAANASDEKSNAPTAPVRPPALVQSDPAAVVPVGTSADVAAEAPLYAQAAATRTDLAQEDGYDRPNSL